MSMTTANGPPVMENEVHCRGCTSSIPIGNLRKLFRYLVATLSLSPFVSMTISRSIIGRVSLGRLNRNLSINFF